MAAHELQIFLQEKDLDHYVKKYIRKRVKTISKSDLSNSLFFNDISLWSDFKKRKIYGLGHYFQQKRIKELILKHESRLGIWIDFLENDCRTQMIKQTIMIDINLNFWNIQTIPIPCLNSLLGIFSHLPISLG
jgi:hypothetical protein